MKVLKALAFIMILLVLILTFREIYIKPDTMALESSVGLIKNEAGSEFEEKKLKLPQSDILPQKAGRNPLPALRSWMNGCP